MNNIKIEKILLERRVNISKDTVIQIIEIISEKLGILVDYISENITPYAIDLMHRYNVYINISNFISLFIKIIILSICIIITKKIS